MASPAGRSEAVRILHGSALSPEEKGHAVVWLSKSPSNIHSFHNTIAGVPPELLTSVIRSLIAPAAGQKHFARQQPVHVG
jgi:hypothetical protein